MYIYLATFAVVIFIQMFVFLGDTEENKKDCFFF